MLSVCHFYLVSLNLARSKLRKSYEKQWKSETFDFLVTFSNIIRHVCLRKLFWAIVYRTLKRQFKSYRRIGLGYWWHSPGEIVASSAVPLDVPGFRRVEIPRHVKAWLAIVQWLNWHSAIRRGTYWLLVTWPVIERQWWNLLVKIGNIK